jgi:hypothetical protein
MGRASTHLDIVMPALVAGIHVSLWPTEVVGTRA